MELHGNKRRLSSYLAFVHCLNNFHQKVCNEKKIHDFCMLMKIHAFQFGSCHMRAEAFGLLRSNRQVFYDEHFTMISSMPLESSFYDCGRWKGE